MQLSKKKLCCIPFLFCWSIYCIFESLNGLVNLFWIHCLPQALPEICNPQNKKFSIYSEDQHSSWKSSKMLFSLMIFSGRKKIKKIHMLNSKSYVVLPGSEWMKWDDKCNLIQAVVYKPLLAAMRVVENGTIRMHCISVNCFSKLLASVDNDQ